jgi:hypothetical protein
MVSSLLPHETDHNLQVGAFEIIISKIVLKLCSLPEKGAFLPLLESVKSLKFNRSNTASGSDSHPHL